MALGHWEFNVQVTLGLWVKRSGAWTRAGTAVATAFQYGGSSGQRTVAWNYSGSHQLGSGIEAFGVTLDGSDQGTATLDDISQIRWNGTAAGTGTRTALPNGSSTTVTVRPK